MIYDSRRRGGGSQPAREEGVISGAREDQICFSCAHSRCDRLHSAAFLVALPCAQSRALHATSRSGGWTPSGPGARTSLTGGLSVGSFWPCKIVNADTYIVCAIRMSKSSPLLVKTQIHAPISNQTELVAPIRHLHRRPKTDDLRAGGVIHPPYFHLPLNRRGTQRFGLRFTQDKEGL